MLGAGGAQDPMRPALSSSIHDPCWGTPVGVNGTPAAKAYVQVRSRRTRECDLWGKGLCRRDHVRMRPYPVAGGLLGRGFAEIVTLGRRLCEGGGREDSGASLVSPANKGSAYAFPNAAVL